MLYFILALMAVIVATIIIWSFIDLSITYSFKEVIKSKFTIPCLIVSIILIGCAIFLFNRNKRNVQSDAIDHYIVGDVELVEKRVDGEVVDWYYKVIPVDYE